MSTILLLSQKAIFGPLIARIFGCHASRFGGSNVAILVVGILLLTAGLSFRRFFFLAFGLHLMEGIFGSAEFGVFEKAILGVMTGDVLLYALWIGASPFGSSNTFGLRPFGRRKKDGCFCWLLGSQFCIIPFPNSLVLDEPEYSTF